MHLYVDGSTVTRNRRVACGWALLSLQGDRHDELWGCELDEGLRQLAGYHEHIAVLRGLLYAHQHAVPPQELTLYCDDPVFGHAPSWLPPDNFCGARRDQLLNRLAQVVDRVFAAQAYVLVAGLLGVAINLAARAVERRLLTWHPSIRHLEAGR